MVTTITADRNTQIITSDLSGDGNPDQIETILNSRAERFVIDTVFPTCRRRPGQPDGQLRKRRQSHPDQLR